MDAGGTYYLANDIIISATYVKEFTGIFDGNGKTITTTRPIFNKVTNGTVKNFTVNGPSSEAKILLSSGGAVVCNEAMGATFKNITNTVNVKSTDTENNHGLATIVGSVAGKANQKTTLVIENCVNKGTVTGATTRTHAGGILGWVYLVNGEKVDLDIKNCRNEGNIDASKAGGIVGYIHSAENISIKGCSNTADIVNYNIGGGVVAQVAKLSKKLLVENCTNSGRISGTGNKYNGGMVGICQIVGSAVEYTGTVIFRNCFNSGTVTGIGGGSHCGGIVGRHYGAIIEYCGNEGTIENADGCGGIVGHTENTNIIRYCYNFGTIKGTKYAAGIVSVSKCPLDKIYGCYNMGEIALMSEDVLSVEGYNMAQIVSVTTRNYGEYYDNFYMEGAKYNNTSIPGAACANEPVDEFNFAFNSADVSTGKLTFDINKALGETVYHQNLSGEKDAYPVFDTTHKTVVKVGDIYTNFAFVTDDAAATRLDGNGLKFTTSIAKTDYDALIAAGVNASDITVGTMITLESYVKDAFINFSKNFNMADFDIIDYAYINASGALVETDGNYVFEGSVVNIPESKLSKTYCAIGYVKIGDEIYYSSKYSSRSVADVAEAAYADRAEAQSDAYNNAIAAGSDVAVDAKASYSPYTETQLAELKTKYRK